MRDDRGCLGGTEINKALVACALDDELGVLARSAVGIGGHNAHAALTCSLFALTRFVKQALPGVCVVELPAPKAPAFAAGSGSAVEHDIDGLEQDTATCTRGVDEYRTCIGLVVFGLGGRGAGLRPARLRQQQGGVVGTQHMGCGAFSGACGLRGQALEQRLARKVEVEARATLAQREHEVRIGVGGVHVGAAPRLINQAVADGVLHAQGRELRVAQLIGDAACRYGKRGAFG